MNPWRFILFSGILILPAFCQSQDVRAYLTRRWLGEGEEIRMIVACRGSVPIAAPEFPELQDFDMGNRYVTVQNQGASRITIYNQSYTPRSTGTFVIPPIIIPFADKVIRKSPGIVTVRKTSTQSYAGYSPATLDAQLVWELDNETMGLGQVQHGVLYLEVPWEQKNHLIWDLGALAEMADSIRRSEGGRWILMDSLKNNGLNEGKREEENIRFPCYEAWWGCPDQAIQKIAGSRLRIQRLWSPVSQYRSARSPSPRWKDEFIEVSEVTWEVRSPANGILSGIAPTGPLTMTASWQKSTLTTGEPLPLTTTIIGNVFLNLVPPPQFKIPEGMVLRGPEIRTSYSITDGALTGTKTLDYLLYPAVKGSYVLPKVKLFWLLPESDQVDSVAIPLPIVTVTGETIPQLLEQQKLESFYDNTTVLGNSRKMGSFVWLLPMAYSLLIGACLMLGFSLKAHRQHLQQKRRQLLRSRRYKGH